MKQLNSLPIFFTLILLLLVPNLAAALFTSEAGEISYQINNSERIVIGTVNEIEVNDYYTNNTITVDEWLYNPLSEKTITVRTNIGTNASQEDEAKFTQNESVLLILSDQRPDKGIFNIPLGELGKHPVSDREAVIEELKARGKWQEENQTGNQKKDTEVVDNTGTTTEDENSNQTRKSNTTPFMSPICVLAAMLGTIIYIRRKQ